MSINFAKYFPIWIYAELPLKYYKLILELDICLFTMMSYPFT